MTDIEIAITVKNMAREMVRRRAATARNITERERDELRIIQDKVVKKLEREGWKDSDTLENFWGSNNKALTLKDLKTYLYPQFKNIFQSF